MLAGWLCACSQAPPLGMMPLLGEEGQSRKPASLAHCSPLLLSRGQAEGNRGGGQAEGGLLLHCCCLRYPPQSASVMEWPYSLLCLPAGAQQPFHRQAVAQAAAQSPLPLNPASTPPCARHVPQAVSTGTWATPSPRGAAVTGRTAQRPSSAHKVPGAVPSAGGPGLLTPLVVAPPGPLACLLQWEGQAGPLACQPPPPTSRTRTEPSTACWEQPLCQVPERSRGSPCDCFGGRATNLFSPYVRRAGGHVWRAATADKRSCPLESPPGHLV